MFARVNRFQKTRCTRLRSHALSTTILVSLLATPLAAQSTRDWDAGNGAPNAPLGGDGIWVESGISNLWQRGALDNQRFVAGDDAVFGPSADTSPYAVTVDTEVNVRDITFDTDGVTIEGAGQLNVGRDIAVTTAGDAAEIAVQIGTDATVDGAGDLTLSGGVDGAVTMEGTGTVSILSTVDSLTATTGTSDVGANGVVTGTTTIAGGDVVVSGGTLTDTTSLSAGSLTVDTGAVGVVANDGGTVEVNGGTVASVANTSGTFRITGGTVSGDTVNDGTLELGGGTLNDVTNNATAVITGAQAVGGDFSNNGVVNATAAGAETLTVDGAFEINTGSNLATDAAGDTTNTLTVTAGNIVINSASAFNGSNDLDGSIVLDGDITNNADIDLTGDLTLSGTLVTNATINQTGALDAGGNTIEVNGGVYSLSGTATIENGGDLRLVNGGNFTIAAGGTAAFNILTLLDTTFDPENVGGGVLNYELLSNEGASVLVVNAALVDAGAVSNAAQVDFQGGSLDRLINTATGIVDVTAGGAVDTTVTNAGTFNATAGTFTYASFLNQAGGALNIAAGAELATTGADINVVTLENATGGQVAIAGTVSGFVANRIDAEMTLVGTSDVERITNNGALIIEGGQIGRLANTALGEAVVTGDTTVAQTVNNFGTFDVMTGTLTALEVVNQNAATFGIAEDSTLAAALTNESGGNVALNGSVSGLVTNRAGGVVTVTGEAAQLTGPAAMINAGTLTLQSGSALSAANGLNNSAGTLNLLAGSFGGDVTGGRINVRGASAEIGGTLDLAGGTINLADGPTRATDTTLRIGGDAVLNGTLNYQLDFDADLEAQTATTDRIIVDGEVSGTPTFQFDVQGDARRLSGVEVLSYETNAGLSLGNLQGFEDIREIDYFLADNGVDSILLQSRVNTGIASLAATVGLTENVVGTIINRPTSPYVADLAVDPGDNKCGVGSWARATGGRADAEGEFTDTVSDLTSTAPVELSYAGVQFGGDLACFGGVYNGWDLAFGGIVGYNKGESTNNVFAIDATGNATDTLNSVTDTDISQKYAGAYLTAARGRLFGDVQLRYEVTDFESTNTAAAGRESFGINLTDEKYQNHSQTLSGSVGYSWPLNEVGDFSFISLAGFQVSQSDTDDIDLGEDGTLELEEKTSKLGFVSGTLAKTTIRPDNMGLLSYFGTATYYNDFSDSQQATLVNGESRNPFDLSNLGSYGELSAGINYVRILNPGQVGNARQFNAAVRLDARTGESVDSWGITAQMRLQF